jgi:hypothetical protein
MTATTEYSVAYRGDMSDSLVHSYSFMTDVLNDAAHELERPIWVMNERYLPDNDPVAWHRQYLPTDADANTLIFNIASPRFTRGSALHDYHIDLEGQYDYLYGCPSSACFDELRETSLMETIYLSDSWADTEPIGADLPVASVAQNLLLFCPQINENSDTRSRNFWHSTFMDWLAMAANALDPTEARIARSDTIIANLSNDLRNNGTGQLRHLNETSRSQMRDITSFRRRTQTLEGQLADTARQIRAIQDARGEHPLSDPDKLRELIDSIPNNPTVADVQPNTTGFNITTEPFPMTVTMNDGEGFTSPNYTYRIELDLVEQFISVYNMSMDIDGYQHPHVSEGEFCLGGARALVHGLLQKHEIVPLVDVLIDQLRVVNPDDCYFSEWHQFFGGELDHYFDNDEY